MKTHIDIDDDLLADAMQLGEWPTKKDAVNGALSAYVRSLKRARLLALKGKISWRGNLDEMRAARADRKTQ